MKKIALTLVFVAAAFFAACSDDSGESETPSCTFIAESLKMCMEINEGDTKDICDAQNGVYSSLGCMEGADLQCQLDQDKLYFYGPMYGVSCEEFLNKSGFGDGSSGTSGSHQDVSHPSCSFDYEAGSMCVEYLISQESASQCESADGTYSTKGCGAGASLTCPFEDVNVYLYGPLSEVGCDIFDD